MLDCISDAPPIIDDLHIPSVLLLHKNLNNSVERYSNRQKLLFFVLNLRIFFKLTAILEFSTCSSK